MENLPFRRFSIVGLVLIGASAITAAILPNNGSRQVGPGVLVDSIGPNNTAQKTCKQNSNLNQCTHTVTVPKNKPANRGQKSRTTTAGGTSVITTVNGGQAKTITVNVNINSSQSPN